LPGTRRGFGRAMGTVLAIAPGMDRYIFNYNSDNSRLYMNQFSPDLIIQTICHERLVPKATD
jgi:hypothetical protein